MIMLFGSVFDEIVGEILNVVREEKGKKSEKCRLRG
jgi:hypothetical protein